MYHENIPTKTLTSVLDEVSPPNIDFMSLDVEGYELKVLQGLNFEKYKPKLIVVECYDNNLELVHNLLSTYYTLDNKISDRDYVYQLK